MQVAVEDPKTGETVEFPCQRWFSTRDDDGQITRELIRADVPVVDDEKTSPVTGKKKRKLKRNDSLDLKVPLPFEHVHT